MSSNSPFAQIDNGHSGTDGEIQQPSTEDIGQAISEEFSVKDIKLRSYRNFPRIDTPKQIAGGFEQLQLLIDTKYGESIKLYNECRKITDKFRRETLEHIQNIEKENLELKTRINELTRENAEREEKMAFDVQQLQETNETVQKTLEQRFISVMEDQNARLTHLKSENQELFQKYKTEKQSNTCFKNMFKAMGIDISLFAEEKEESQDEEKKKIIARLNVPLETGKYTFELKKFPSVAPDEDTLNEMVVFAPIGGKVNSEELANPNIIPYGSLPSLFNEIFSFYFTEDDVNIN
ncbi:hypothetical protein PCE1_002461 [Barthelona sp. PCE]